MVKSWAIARAALAVALVIGAGAAIGQTEPPVTDAETGGMKTDGTPPPAEPIIPAVIDMPPPADAAPRDPGRGQVTNLPLPRYVTLKTNEGNARRGPGLTHRIDWVFTRAGMPLKITAEYGHWRRIEDADGIGGWVHYSLLSGVRSVLVKADLLDIFSAPRPDASVLFRAEGGVIAKILECANDWCRITVEGEKGWSPAAALWGVDPGEVLE